MQNKNFILFMVSCLVIIMSWVYLQNQLWPPRPQDPNKLNKKDERAKAKDAPAKTPAEVLGANIAANRFGIHEPLIEAARLALDLHGARELFPKQVAAQKPEPKPEVKPEVKVEPEPPVERYTIGDKTTHIRAVLTTKGAGIQQLILNRFDGADYLGLPTGQSLELIPDDPHRPSFALFHYANAKSKDERPLTTLGERVWKYEGRRETGDGDDKAEEHSFSTRLPGQEHIKITKTYRLGARDYHLGLILEFERDRKTSETLHIRYQLAGAYGMPIEGEWYTSVFRNAMVGMIDSSGTPWRSLDDAYRVSHRHGGDAIPEGDRGGSFLQYAVSATQYFASGIVVDDQQPSKKDGGVDRKNILAWARATPESSERRGLLRAVEDNALVVGESEVLVRYTMLPHVQRHLERAKLRANDKVVVSYYTAPDGRRIATWVRRGQTARPFLDDLTVRVVSEPIAFESGDTRIVHRFMLYNGPVKTRLLGQFSGERAVPAQLVDRYAETLQLRTMTDWPSPGPISAFFHKIGWTKLLIWTTSLMHILLHWLSFAGYGISIVLLTVLVRGAMFKISKKQAQFSIRMQELAPELKKINEKYKGDAQARTQATMELYRKHKVHPLGGCLPILLQMPIFLGLYYALQESIHFRLAPFLWIDNLAAPDMLLWWTESIPWLSDPDSQGGIFYLGPYLNVLPIFAVALMFFQQKMLMPPPTSDEQAMQQKVMQYMMIFMAVLFYKVAAGLCIYFIASSVWGLAERKLLPKKSAEPPAPPAAKTPAKGKPKPGANGDGAVEKVKNWWAKLLEDAKKK